jgi:hypothetical protein
MDEREYRRAESEARRDAKPSKPGHTTSEDALTRYLAAAAYHEERTEETTDRPVGRPEADDR